MLQKPIQVPYFLPLTGRALKFQEIIIYGYLYALQTDSTNKVSIDNSLISSNLDLQDFPIQRSLENLQSKGLIDFVTDNEEKRWIVVNPVSNG